MICRSALVLVFVMATVANTLLHIADETAGWLLVDLPIV